MSELDFFSIKVANFRCFGENPQGFDSIKGINIIIGGNNSGKSSLLEMLRRTIDVSFAKSDYNKGNEPRIHCSLDFSNEFFESVDVANAFSMDRGHVNSFREKVLGMRINCVLEKPSLTARATVGFQNLGGSALGAPYSVWAENILTLTFKRFVSNGFVRLGAERDIVPEMDDTSVQSISLDDVPPSGRGATKVFRRILNNNDLSLRRYVTHRILPDFNKIIGDRWKVSELLCLLNPKNNLWEVHLQYSRDLIVPLSAAGGGIKTILLVLLWIHVVPEVVLGSSLSRMSFCFEELENSLHPAVQRRLFEYLGAISAKEGSLLFVASHSHVLIDMFRRDGRAQIVHVNHDAEFAEVVTVSSFNHHSKVFDDLGARASDLLQSNCVVWVEGPSDRLYFNRWMEILDPELQEHVDYEFAFTSGTLISHASYDSQAAENPDVDRLIHALRINRNVVVLLDRDKCDGSLKGWVERVVGEVDASGGMSWVTYGKEVENYIPVEVLRECTGEPELGEVGLFTDIVALVKTVTGKKTMEKVALAKQICPLLSKESIWDAHDLVEKMELAVGKIRNWNARYPKSEDKLFF